MNTTCLELITMKWDVEAFLRRSVLVSIVLRNFIGSIRLSLVNLAAATIQFQALSIFLHFGPRVGAQDRFLSCLIIIVESYSIIIKDKWRPALLLCKSWTDSRTPSDRNFFFRFHYFDLAFVRMTNPLIWITGSIWNWEKGMTEWCWLF